MIKTPLTIFFLIFFSAPAFAETALDLMELIHENKCAACHRISKEDPGGSYQGPDLFYAGNKFQSKWLTEFLLNPETIREAGHITDPGFLKGQPAMRGPHPTLSAEEAALVGGGQIAKVCRRPGLRTFATTDKTANYFFSNHIQT